MTDPNQSARDTDDTSPLPPGHQVPPEPPGKFVNPAEMSIVVVQCPVCGGRRTPDMECYDENICKAIVELQEYPILLAGSVLDDSPLTEDEARALQERGDANG